MFTRYDESKSRGNHRTAETSRCGEKPMQYTTSAGRQAAVMALAFVVLNALDLVLTTLILQSGGTELNPIVGAALQMGIPATAALKLGLSAMFAWLLWRLGREGALRLATFMILGVCLFNAVGLTLGGPLS